MEKRGFQISARGTIFLAILAIESLLLLVDRFYISPPTEDRDSAWFFGITVINLVFCAYFAFSAVLTENKYEMIAFFFAAFLLTIRVALDYLWRNEDCIRSGLLGVCVTSVALVGCLFFVYLYLGYTIIKQMGWKFFREAGSEVALRELYITYQGFLSCLKLDFQMVIVMLFTGLFYSEDYAYRNGVLVACIMSVLEVIWEIIGLVSVRLENAIWFRVFFLMGLGLTPSYTVFFLYHFSSTVTFQSVFTKLAIIAGIVVINRLVLSYFGIRVFRNFGKGLRSKLFVLPDFQFRFSMNGSAPSQPATNESTQPKSAQVVMIDENEDSSKNEPSDKESDNEVENSQFPPSNSLSVVSPIGGSVTHPNRASISSSFPPDFGPGGEEIKHSQSHTLIHPSETASDVVTEMGPDQLAVRSDSNLDSSAPGAISPSLTFSIPTVTPAGNLPPIPL